MKNPLLDKVIKFRDSRDWKKFHNPKDMVLSLVLESSELLEHFQWKDNDTSLEHIALNKSEIADEVADVYYWLLLISNDFGIDLDCALENKLVKNEKKYPIDKFFGKSTKYNKL